MALDTVIEWRYTRTKYVMLCNLMQLCINTHLIKKTSLMTSSLWYETAQVVCPVTQLMLLVLCLTHESCVVVGVA